MIAAASQPYHDWQRLRRLHPRAPNVDCQAVLVALDFLPDDLRADRAEVTAVAHARPAFGGLRRLPAQRSDGRPRIGNALERKHIAFDDTADRALRGTGNVRIIGGTARHLRRGG